MDFNYSVVATTFNDEKSVERFVKEISQQTLAPKEIVIADGGSKDSTVEILNKLAKVNNIQIVVLSGKRLNIAEGYNTAIKNASCEFIGITGLGNKYEADYFEQLAQKIDRDKLDGAYSPVRGLDTTIFSRRYNKDLLDGEKGQRMEIASNHGVLVKKEVFDKQGYFYEKFIYAGEDTEFFRLVKESGFHMEIVPDAYVRWETPGSIKDFKKQTKVYSIAGLQINPYEQFSMVGKNAVKLCLLLLYMVVLITLVIIPIVTIWRIVVLCVMSIPLLLFYKKIRPMRIAQMFLQVYYTITNCKYAKEEYRVKRLTK